MKIIYGIVSGQYDDYTIHCVTETEQEAQCIVNVLVKDDVMDYIRVKEIPLIEPDDEIHKIELFMCSTIIKNNTAVERNPILVTRWNFEEHEAINYHWNNPILWVTDKTLESAREKMYELTNKILELTNKILAGEDV